MKSFVVLISFIFFSSCSLFKNIVAENIDIKKKQNFVSSLSNNFKIKYSDEGSFIELKVKYLVNINIDMPSSKNKAIEDSFTNAKKDISYFIMNTVISDDFKNQILNTLKLSSFYQDSKNQEILNNLISDIQKREKSIIKNIYIDSSSYNRKMRQISITVNSSGFINKTIKKINSFF